MATTAVNELSDCYAVVSYFDTNGNPYTPVSVQWRLWDDTNKITVQDWTSIASPGQSNTIDIPAALNTIGNAANLVEVRLIILHIVAPGGASRYDDLAYNLIAIPDVP